MLRLETRENSYRAKRLSLWHSGDNLHLGTGTRLGILIETVSAEHSVRPLLAETIIPPSYQMKLTEENDRFTISGRLRENSEAYLLLRSMERYIPYHIPTSRNALNAGSVAEDGTIEITFTVNKVGLSGEKTVELEVDGILYTTGRVISC